MKNLLSWKLAAGLALFIIWAWPAVAQTHTLRANVPFPFVAAGQSLAAGQYVFTLHTDRALGYVTAAASSDGCFVPLVPGSYYRAATDTKKGMLRFAKYGSHYVLTGIWQPGEVEGKTVAGSRPPKEYSRAMVPTEVVELH